MVRSEFQNLTLVRYLPPHEKTSQHKQLLSQALCQHMYRIVSTQCHCNEEKTKTRVRPDFYHCFLENLARSPNLTFEA